MLGQELRFGEATEVLKIDGILAFNSIFDDSAR